MGGVVSTPWNGALTLGDLRKLDMPDDTVVAVHAEVEDFTWMLSTGYDAKEDQIVLVEEEGRIGDRDEWEVWNDDHECPGYDPETLEGECRCADKPEGKAVLILEWS